jgi:isopentenyl diphosphate isomerase/L-lactate dehydrogenase-like FMN-dependent dehydrogenase
MTDFACSQEVAEAAHRNLPRPIWDYVNGAAGSETTMRRNRFALDSYAFLPRVLRDVSKIDCATRVLGHKLRMPIFLAPMGSMQLINAEGALAAGRAAGRFGTMQMLSSVARHSLEEVAAQNPAPKIYQLYIRGNMAWIGRHLERARAAGYVALAMTVDSALYGIRDRHLLNRFERPSARNKGEDREFQAAVTWEQMKEIKSAWGGPMILKGIATAADARLAVEHGIEAVYVSNHGGRELDHGRGTMDMLPEIVEAVGDRAEVWIDGGFVRGTDVVKALCLGARAVGIARLQAWALAAGGEAALHKVLENLEVEVRNTMGLLGVTRLADLGKEYVTQVQPLGPWHELSSFRHLGSEALR